MSLKIRFILIVFLCSSPIVSTLAQTSQQGRVVIQNSGNKVLPGVQVTVYGAPPTDTDNDGRFALTFGKAVPGDLVPLKEAYKKGYELVNKKETERWILSPTEMVIVMAEAGSIRQAREHYYEIGQSRYMHRYEQTVTEIEALEQQHKLTREDYTSRLEEAYNQLEKSQKLLDKYADLFARVNRDELTDLERRAFALLNTGRVDEAVALYEEQKLVEKLTAQGVSKERVAKELQEMLPSLKHYADVCVFAGGHENLARAGEIYRAIVEADPADFENLMTYGKFLFETVDIPASITCYKQAVDLAPSEPMLAEALIHLSMAYVVEKNFSPAEEYYNRAIGLLEKALNEEPDNDFYLQRKIFARMQLSVLYFYSKEPDKAIAASDEASRENEKLRKSDTLTCLRNEALHLGMKVVNGLQMVENNIFRNNAKDLEKDGLRAIELNKRLVVTEDNLEHGTMLTSMLVNMGGYYRSEKKFREAEKYLLEALALEEKMAIRNPMLLKVEIALLHNQLGILHTLEGQIDKGLAHFEKSMSISEELYELNPNAFTERLSNSYQALALFHRKNNEPEKGMPYLIRSLEILDKVPEKYIKSVVPLKANAYYESGMLSIMLNRPEQAERLFLSVLELSRMYPDVDITNHRAVTLDELAAFYADDEDNKWLDYAMQYVAIVSENMNIAKPVAACALAEAASQKGNNVMDDNYRVLCLVFLEEFIDERNGNPIDVVNEQDIQYADAARLIGMRYLVEEKYEEAGFFFGLYMTMIPRVEHSKANENLIMAFIETLMSRVKVFAELKKIEDAQVALNDVIPYIKYALKNNFEGISKEDLREVEQMKKDVDQLMK